jgi:VWFA-related protein
LIRIRFIAAVALALATTAAWAQTSSSQKQPEIPKLVETMNVRLVNIDVVVTDSKGNPIKGLKKDDFEIWDNGQPQKVSNFYEVERAPLVRTASAPAAKAATPVLTPAAAVAPAEEVPLRLQRKFIFFIDNLSLAPFHRNDVFRAMHAFIRDNMQPGDQGMIATFNHDIKVRVDFTSETKPLEQALDAISEESAYGTQNLAERRQVESQVRDADNYDDAVSTARHYALSVENDLRQTVNAINGLITTLAGVEGKKVLVLTSEGLQMVPGRELFQYIDEIAKQKQWHDASTYIEGQTYNSSSLIESIARSANANGITIYALHAGGLSGNNDYSAENQTPTPSTVQQAALSNSTDSMRLLALSTGGIATVGTNNFAGAFRRIALDLQSYYSLGYSSPSERIDRQRSIEVRTKNRNYIVRARKTFVEKSMQTEVSDRLVANLFYSGQPNDLNIFLTTERPEQLENGFFRVAVEVHIPMESLALLEQGEVYRGSFTVYAVAGNNDGDMSETQQQQHAMSLRPEEMKNIKGTYYTYVLPLMMREGRNTISIGVVDDATNMTGYARQEILAKNLQ